MNPIPKFVLYANNHGYIQYIERWWDGVVEYGYTQEIKYAKLYKNPSSALRAAKAYKKRTGLECKYIKITN